MRKCKKNKIVMVIIAVLCLKLIDLVIFSSECMLSSSQIKYKTILEKKQHTVITFVSNGFQHDSFELIYSDFIYNGRNIKSYYYDSKVTGFSIFFDHRDKLMIFLGSRFSGSSYT